MLQHTSLAAAAAAAAKDVGMLPVLVLAETATC
jgi:hypothetical protein